MTLRSSSILSCDVLPTAEVRKQSQVRSFDGLSHTIISPLLLQVRSFDLARVIPAREFRGMPKQDK
jgi:hypothetical protein